MPPLNNLETPPPEKDRSVPSAESLGAKLVRRAVDSGIDYLTEDQRAAMRSHLESKPMPERVRAVCDPGKIAEHVTCELTALLGREPSADECRELAAVLCDAAAQIEAEADQ